MSKIFQFKIKENQNVKRVASCKISFTHRNKNGHKILKKNQIVKKWIKRKNKNRILRCRENIQREFYHENKMKNHLAWAWAEQSIRSIFINEFFFKINHFQKWISYETHLKEEEQRKMTNTQTFNTKWYTKNQNKIHMVSLFKRNEYVITLLVNLTYHWFTHEIFFSKSSRLICV